MRYGELFAGIRGMGLGLDGAGMECAWVSENAPFPSRLIAARWPQLPNLGDIKLVDWKDVERVDLIAGGYPCPAFSQAARGRNVAEDLWPYMRAAIAELQPRFVLLENVAAHLGRGFAGVLADLDELGFDAEWSVVTACSVDAPHTRRRLFCVAYADRDGERALSVDAEVAWSSPLQSPLLLWPPTPGGVGMAHGVPDRMDRLRALGNAVVPAVVEMIGRRIMEVAA